MPILIDKFAYPRDSDYELVSDQWQTPPEEYARACEEWSFQPQIDAFASANNSLCPLFITRKMNALTLDWLAFAKEHAVQPHFWANPPYSREILGAAVKKMHEEAQKGCTILTLIPVSTSTRWFHNYVNPLPEAQRRWREGRIKFNAPPGYPNPKRPSGDNLYVLFKPTAL